MDIVKLLGLALVSMMLYSVLRQYNQTYAILVSLACCAVLMLMALRTVQPVFAFVRKMSAYAQWGNFAAVFKAAAIALITQFTQDLCKESGQNALAGRVEFAGKAAMLVCAMPLFASLADIILELLQ